MFTEEELSVLHDTRKKFVRLFLKKIDSKNLIEHYSSRVKTDGSIREKLDKKNLEPSPANAYKYLSDIIGIRIVVHFVGDVYDIAAKARKYFQIKEEIDYISSPKENGYRSLHMIVDFPVSDSEKFGFGKTIPVEIQIRTVAMDCWASLEHQILYKKKRTPQIELAQKELMHCAETLFSTDIKMEAIQNIIQKTDMV